MATVLRGAVVTLALIAGLLIAAACAPAAQPTPAAAPTKAAPASQPAAATPMVAKPAASEAPKPAAVPEWKVEWDKVVAAAKKEGKVVVAGPRGDLNRQAAMEFQKAYPEITLEYTGISGSDLTPRIMAERGADRYLWDVLHGGSQTTILALKPNGVLDPLKPAMILPEVLDDSKWLGGLDNNWMDTEGKYILGMEAALTYNVWVNRKFVPETELKTHDQLLDPKWKGKIVSRDPGIPSAAMGITAHLLYVKGEAWVGKFFENVVFMDDERMIMESAIRGTHPIKVGVNPALYRSFAQEGLLDDLKVLDPDGEAGAVLSSGPNTLSLVNKAANPNAAKVFINWLLSREAQQVLADATGMVSARLDVKSDPFWTPKPDKRYVVNTSRENMLPYNSGAADMAKKFK